MIGSGHLVRHIFLGQAGERSGAGNLHFLIDGPGAYVERAAENIGKTKHIIDLIGIIRPAGGHDGILADLADGFRADFRFRIGHGKDDRIPGHGPDHVLIDRSGHRQAKETICPLQGFGQRPRLGRRGVGGFPLIHAVFAALIDRPAGIA